MINAALLAAQVSFFLQFRPTLGIGGDRRTISAVWLATSPNERGRRNQNGGTGPAEHPCSLKYRSIVSELVQGFSFLTRTR